MNKLNKEVKKLYHEMKRYRATKDPEDWSEKDWELHKKHVTSFDKRFREIYRSDPGFQHLDLESVKMIISLNFTYRFIPPEEFGSEVEI